MSPADEKALLQQGIAAARAGDKATARARFRELTARNFDNELAWLWLASVADTPAHAIACLRRVLQINPSHDKARAALFRVLMEGGIQTARSGDRAAAFASFSECSTIDPGSELVWTWMASTAPSPGQALDALRRVLQLNPAHDQAGRAYKKLVVQRGVDLAQAGDAGARDVLLEAAQVDPNNETVWLWLARAVPAEESIEYYERVLQINPAHDIARAALQQLRAPTPAPAAVAVATEPEPYPDLPGIDPLDEEMPDPTDMPDPTEMVVEQFGHSEASAQPTALSQASTQEEFLVYQSADITTVWAPPGAGSGGANTASSDASSDADEDTQSDATHEIGAHEIDAVMVAETSVRVEAAESEELAPLDTTGMPAEVAAYLSASESTYASSELAVSTPQALAQEEGDADLDLHVPESEPDAAAPVAAAESTPPPVAAAPAVPSDAPIAWTCPICLSGAPAHAMRCPTCGSVASLLDPDLLLDTEPVDRRHVLQVVARLKNRKVSGNKHQFDHAFALGLAYLNAGRVQEGIQHLRTASGLQPKDTELKAQIDTLERRAAHRAKHAAAKPAAPKVNGKSTKTPEQPAVDLPMTPAPVDEPKGAPAPASHQGTNGHGSRRLILVVDDSPTIQKVVSVTLEAHGHEVVTASDGMEALSKLRTIKPDLVLLDITMPHMDGYQLCRILRSNDLTRQVPIVMLSGKDGLFDKMRGRMAGAASYITKPFAPSALPPLVEKFCKRANG